MKQSERNIRARQKWLQAYAQLESVTKAAVRCGISRSTLYRWIERAKSDPDSKLISRNVPKNSPILRLLKKQKL